MPKKKSKGRLLDKLQAWVDARKRFHLSHAHVQMARELGMNPKRLGKIANHKQEPWKAPLPEFIEHLYFKRFGRNRPEVVMSIEERHRTQQHKKEAKRVAKVARRIDEVDTARIGSVDPNERDDERGTTSGEPGVTAEDLRAALCLRPSSVPRP